ncbi:uncharacterized protein [Asterias amurensis]|uniref:uncharacterized protein n=1 Tax=Asterias amurensis TaxID=7602 RepID=UPI003AB5B1A3
MNPIWRATMEMSKARSENQKQIKKRQEMQRDKTRKEKERRRVEALERDRQRFIVGQELIPEDLEKEEELEDVQESAAEKFQKELCWCIQQAKVGLASIKPSSKEAKPQTEEAQKLLRTLTSIKAPMAKKRQVMRATFGDYRNKMHQEERQHKANMSKKMCVEQASPKKRGCGTFLRMSVTASGDAASQITPTSNDRSEKAGSSGHLSRSSVGHDPEPAGHELGTSDTNQGSSRGDQGMPGNQDVTLDCPATKGHDLGSSGDDRLKNGEDDSTMQDLEKSTENMHILNPESKDSQRKNLDNNDENRSHEWQQISHNQNAANKRKMSQEDEDSTTLELSEEIEKPSDLSLNLNKGTNSFSFNFSIGKDDLDQQEARLSRSPNNKNIEESQSESSTPEKALGSGRRKPGSRKRNRSKKKQQHKEATVATGNQKMQLEADGEFKFNFPAPT